MMLVPPNNGWNIAIFLVLSGITDFKATPNINPLCHRLDSTVKFLLHLKKQHYFVLTGIPISTV